MEDYKELLEKIVLEKIVEQINDGWDSSYTIAEHIIGTDAWLSSK